MEVTLPPEVRIAAQAEADRHGVTLAQWLAQAARAAAAYEAQVNAAQADAEQMLAEIGPVDPALLADIDAALDRAEARQAARVAEPHHPAA